MLEQLDDYRRRARSAAIVLEVGGEVYARDAAAHLFDKAREVHMKCGEADMKRGSRAHASILFASSEMKGTNIVPENPSTEAEEIAVRDSRGVEDH